MAAARAGTDLLLFTRAPRRRSSGRALTHRLRSGELPRPPFEDSVRRVLDLRSRIAAG